MRVDERRSTFGKHLATGSASRGAKRLLVTLGKILLYPIYGLYKIRLFDYPTVGHVLSLIPGKAGIGIRRSWYEMSLQACGTGLVVEFLAAFRTPRTRVGNHCYIGIGSWIGWAEIGDHFMSDRITILSGRHQHGYSRIDVPMHLQPGRTECIRIGEDVWVGSGAVIAANVSSGTIIGAGAVITKTFPEYAIVAGVPAAQIGNRREE